MPDLSAVLSQLAVRLRDSGATFAPLPLEVTAAAISFLRRDPMPIEIANVTRRLCLGTVEHVGWSLLQQYRTDFIGHEIDRFFRTTKAAVPGTVTISERMARGMGLVFRRNRGGIYAVLSGKVPLPLRGGIPLDPVYCRKRKLSERKLKGIGYTYDTFTLFAPRTLKGIYVKMQADKENEVPTMQYGDTAKLISPALVKELASRFRL